MKLFSCDAPIYASYGRKTSGLHVACLSQKSLDQSEEGIALIPCPWTVKTHALWFTWSLAILTKNAARSDCSMYIIVPLCVTIYLRDINNRNAKCCESKKSLMDKKRPRSNQDSTLEISHSSCLLFMHKCYS